MMSIAHCSIAAGTSFIFGTGQPFRNLTFNDEDAMIAPLEQLQQAYAGADIYVNGELTVDFPEDVKIPIEPNQMVTAALSGNRVKFEYCGLSRAIALLKEQYAVGTVEVKIVTFS